MQHLNSISRVTFDRRGDYVITSAGEVITKQTTYLWDGRTGARVGKPLGHENKLDIAYLSPQNDYIVLITEFLSEYTVHAFDIGTGSLLGKFSLPGYGVGNVEFSQFENIIVMQVGTILYLWDLRSAKDPRIHKDSIFVPSERRIVTWKGKTANQLDAAGKDTISKPMQHEFEIVKAAFSPKTNSLLMVGSNKGQLWDAHSGSRRGNVLRLSSSKITFSPASDRIRAIGNNEVQQWDALTGVSLGKGIVVREGIQGAEFDPIGDRVLVLDKRGELRIWDAKDGLPIGEPIRHDQKLHEAILDVEGARALTRCWDGSVRLWDARTATLLGDTMWHHLESRMDFNSRGDRLFIGDKQGAFIYVVPLLKPRNTALYVEIQSNHTWDSKAGALRELSYKEWLSKWRDFEAAGGTGWLLEVSKEQSFRD